MKVVHRLDKEEENHSPRAPREPDLFGDSPRCMALLCLPPRRKEVPLLRIGIRPRVPDARARQTCTGKNKMPLHGSQVSVDCWRLPERYFEYYYSCTCTLRKRLKTRQLRASADDHVR